MLLLLTILLVLIAAVTLLIGIFSDQLTLIYVSIASSILAALVLTALSQISKRGTQAATPAGTPAPLDQAPTPTPSVTPRVEEPTLVTPAATLDDEFPMPGYDDLRVSDILPRLATLDLDQLEQVAQREEDGKNRSTILSRIDELMDELEAEGAGAVADTVAAEAPRAASAAGAAASLAGLPIADYDDLDSDVVIMELEELDADELETIAEYEETHANRDEVLDAIDDRLDILEGVAPAPVAAKKSAAKSVAKKAPAKKSVAKKAPAKKAPAKAIAKKASATRATATRATAKKSTAVKKTGAATRKASAPAKKTAAKKAVAKKAPAKKAGGAKKTAKKAARR